MSLGSAEFTKSLRGLNGDDEVTMQCKYCSSKTRLTVSKAKKAGRTCNECLAGIKRVKRQASKNGEDVDKAKEIYLKDRTSIGHTPGGSIIERDVVESSPISIPKPKMLKLDTRKVDISSQFENVIALINGTREDLNNAFEKVNVVQEGLTNVSEKVGILNTRIDGNESAVSFVFDRIDTIDVKVNSNIEAIGTIDVRVNSNKLGLNTVSTKVNSMGMTIDGLVSDVSRLESLVDKGIPSSDGEALRLYEKLSKRLESIESLKQMERKVNQLSTTVDVKNGVIDELEIENNRLNMLVDKLYNRVGRIEEGNSLLREEFNRYKSVINKLDEVIKKKVNT